MDRPQGGPALAISALQAGLRRHEATIPALGGVPERPKGTGCKPVGSAYGGSNPPAPIRSLLPSEGFALKLSGIRTVFTSDEDTTKQRRRPGGKPAGSRRQRE